jgi:hypothetical protein
MEEEHPGQVETKFPIVLLHLGASDSHEFEGLIRCDFAFFVGSSRIGKRLQQRFTCFCLLRSAV